MLDNYRPIHQLTDKLLREYYSQIEKELEEIINAPSLLARLSKYYHLYHDPEEMNMCVLIFMYDKQVWFIKKWSIDEFLDHIRFKQQVKLWYEMGMSVHEPSIVIPHFPK